MTDLEAANKALILIGVEPVGALSDNSRAARTVNALIPTTKSAVLCEFPWSFASRIAAGVPSGTAAPAGFAYAFVYPAGAMNIFRVFDAEGKTERYAVHNGVIATDAKSVWIEYALNVPSLAAWRHDVQEAFVARLAHDAAYTLIADQQLAVSLFEKYSVLVGIAKNNSAVERHPGGPYDLTFALADNYLAVRG